MRISPLSLLLLSSTLALPAVAGEPKTAVLDIPAMYCSLCSSSVRKILERVPGVLETSADSSAKRAQVRYDPDKISPPQLAEALGKNGYPATIRP